MQSALYPIAPAPVQDWPARVVRASGTDARPASGHPSAPAPCDSRRPRVPTRTGRWWWRPVPVGDLVVDDDDGNVAAAFRVAEQDLGSAAPAGVGFDGQDRAPDSVGAGTARVEGPVGALRHGPFRNDVHPSVRVGIEHPLPDRLAVRCGSFLTLGSSRILGSRDQFVGIRRVEKHPVTAPRQRARLYRNGPASLLTGHLHNIPGYSLDAGHLSAAPSS